MIKRIANFAIRVALYRGSIGAAVSRRLLRSLLPLCPRSLLNTLSYNTLLEIRAVDRPHYGYCMYAAAKLAQRLGHEAISVIEFGVAGGNGLLAAEGHARDISRELGVQFQIYGFDTGAGLPAPIDYRDLPYHWQAGFFAMNQEVLNSRLTMSQLVIGDVRETTRYFFGRYNPAPIGCIFCDLDFYSSTLDSLQIFNGDNKYFLPRVFMYFDDIIGSESGAELYSDFTGERLAIAEFNEHSSHNKISPAYYLRCQPSAPAWHHQIFVHHDFEHPQYCTFIGKPNQQLTLR